MDPRLQSILATLIGGGQLPRFARGGVVNEPTVGILGEDGPEAVVPLKLPYSGNKEELYPYYWGSPEGQSKRMLAAGTSAGAFRPDFLRRQMRRGALRTAQGGRRRADVLGRLAGLDPMQQRQGMVESEIESSGGVAEALNRADLQGLSGYQDFIRQLLGGERGYQQELTMQQRRERAAREAEERQRGDVFGQLFGTAAGSLIGG
jgi:hypothetical protein